MDISADEVEELYVQYWRLSKLHDLETLYHEAKYSLSMLLQLFQKLKDNKITKDEDISTLVELVNNGLPYLRDEVQDLSNHLAALEKEKAVLNKEILRLRNSIHENNEVISRQDGQSRKLDRKLDRLYVLLQDASKDPKYQKVMERIDQRLNDRKPLLVAAFVAVMETLKTNPYGLNLLNGTYVNIETYLSTDNDGKELLEFAELCYNNLLKNYAKTMV